MGLVELVARAIDQAAMNWADAPGNELNISEECPADVLARAVIPIILEAAAKVAEALVGDRGDIPERLRIASAIRSLVDKGEGR